MVIAVTTASPFGGGERATGRWLPFLRLGATVALTAGAFGALAAAGIGGHLAGGTVVVARNAVGLVGIGLLCAVVLGAALAWVGTTAYMLVAVFAVYTQWHGPAMTTPWIWPARPPDDLGAAICAASCSPPGCWASQCVDHESPSANKERNFYHSPPLRRRGR